MAMNDDLKKLLVLERKNKRELAELRAIRKKLGQQVNPDQKMIAQVDAEIKRLTT